MKVLVTGSSGFIGTHLMERLLKSEYDVWGLDCRAPTRPGHERFFHQCDLLDKKRVAHLLKEYAPQCVIHLAARTDLEEKRDLSGYAANVAGVENLLSAIEECAPIRRSIFTSSQLACASGYPPSNESGPQTLYGQSKALGEQIVRARDGAGRAWCIVRPTTVWGPGMSLHYQRFLKLISNGRYLHVGRRRCLKSWGYVGNIACQYQKLLEAPVEEIHRKLFYLADYDPLSLREWADALQAELGARPIKTIPRAAAWAAAKAGDILNRAGFPDFPFNSFRLNNVLRDYVVDLAETRKVCGELPYSTKEGIRETAAWFKTS